MKHTLLKLLTVLLLISSCNKDKDDLDPKVTEGGLFNLSTANIIYDIGYMEDKFPISLSYYTVPSSKIKSIEVYQQFFTTDDNDSVISSDIKLFRTLDLSQFNSPGYLTTNVTFKELAKSTTLNGVAIDTIDSELNSGFKWILTYVAVMEDGRTLPLYNKQTIFENLKLLDDISIAGTYEIIEKKYYRIGALRNDLDDDWETTTTITAINSKTFRLGTYIGPFEGAGNVIFSLLDIGSTSEYNIKYYKAFPGFSVDDLLINGQPAIFCPDDDLSLTNVGACMSGNNTLYRGDNDTLIMSFGYLASTGSREFYYKMVKQ